MFKFIDIFQARVLIVDDQPVNIQLLRQLLAGAGYSQVSATTLPQEVDSLHQAEPFDLILLDLQMPGMDGFAVMEMLKRSKPDGYLPVIVLTAQPAHKIRALEAGARDFISKPFDLVEVKTRIQNMLEVRLLYRQLGQHNEALEELVAQRTAQLRASEERYRRLTQLASDWHWEQDENGKMVHTSGPVSEILGIGSGTAPGAVAAVRTTVWEEAQREALRATIEARIPFIDFVFRCRNLDGSRQQFRVSGEPIFTPSGRFAGYRGVGVEFFDKPTASAVLA